jgi:6-pyruvoyltetrahydropterin/6-carboxytetrahydropterin synthase
MEDFVYIVRRETFCAAHKLYNENWTVEKNEDVFGKCSNHFWHGHNFELYITVKGRVNPETGFVANLKDLSGIVRKEVINELDHKNLNLDVPWFRNILASTENLAIAIWRRLEPLINDESATLHCVKLKETENNYVEYYGGKLPEKITQ